MGLCSVFGETMSWRNNGRVVNFVKKKKDPRCSASVDINMFCFGSNSIF
jgi:hypothetical protein